jgi:5-methylcytosine-specific restriction endonuclease McrA
MDAPVVAQKPGALCSATIQGEPCTRKVKAKGLCSLHYDRMRHHVDMDARIGSRKDSLTFSSPEGAERRCPATFEGEPCPRPVTTLGLCALHYQRERNGADMDAPVGIPRSEPICSATIDGNPCDRPHSAEGLCQGHRSRRDTGADMDAPWQIRDPYRLCPATVEGEPCERPVSAGGLCTMHYHRERNGIDMDAALGVPIPDRICESTLEGEPCLQPVYAEGVCSGHYQRRQFGTDMDAPWQVHDATRPCTATIQGEPCDRYQEFRGLCNGHYARVRQGTDMDAPWRIIDPSRTCARPDCDEPYGRNGLCNNHARLDRRHRKRAAQVEPNGFSAERLAGRLSMFGNTCWICGEEISDAPSNYSQDHVKPIHAGGAHTPANIRPAHRSCNASKSAKWPFDTSTAHLRLDPARLP